MALPDWVIEQIIRHPELYTFVQDPSAGLFSAIIPEIQKLSEDKLGVETLDDAKALVASQIAEAKEGIIEIDIATEEDDIGQRQVIERNKALLENIAGEAVLAATVVAQVVTPRPIAEVIDEQWRLPVLSSMMQHGRDVHLREYQSSFIPMLNRHYLRKHTPLLPETYRLAIAAAMEIINDKDYKEYMAQSGLSDNWADVWRLQNENYPDLVTSLALKRREELSDEQLDFWLSRLSMPPDVRNEVKKLEFVIPPLTDLIRMAVREAFGDHTYEAQYPEYESWAKKMGLSDYFAGAYWYAHWDRIALAQMYDNLYRGFWSEERFKAMLRIKDIHPDDRDAIFNVAFRPPSLREMGYGWDTGVYKEGDIKKYRQWGGLSPDDATLSARSMVAYRTEAEREAVRREYMYLFSLEKIDEDEYREALERLITAEEAIELWVERGILLRERKLKPLEPIEPRVVTASESKWHFTHGLRDESWYREKLEDLDWDAERVSVAVERAIEELKPAEPTPPEEEYRALTIAQIGDLYRFRKISAEELPQAFMGIGYNPIAAENLAQMLIQVRAKELAPRAITSADIGRFYDMGVYSELDLRPAYEELGYSTETAVKLALWTKINIMFPDLKAMYSKGWITSAIMFEELLDLGLSKERAQEMMMTVVKAEQPTRLEAERSLTKSEIVKGVKAELISADQGVSLLMDLGYEEWEAWYILAVNKVVAVGDPEGYWDMKRVTEAYKKAVGQKSKEVPEELLILEQRVKDLRLEVKKLQAEGATEEDISLKAIELNEAEANYRRLMQAWERGETE